MKVYIDSRDFKVYLNYLSTGLQTTEKFDGMVFPRSDKSAKSKTNRLYDIRVEPEDKENSSSDELFSFMRITHSAGYAQFSTKCNYCLRSLGKKVYDGRRYDRTNDAIEPDLTSYWNRHTWATFAAKIGIPMEIIGRALGYSIWNWSVRRIRYI